MDDRRFGLARGGAVTFPANWIRSHGLDSMKKIAQMSVR
ncbi:hypothetical protein SGL43_03049 [Streptomyces globisporus]|uniref:Uncharacterized protein n=1 Tax=Streptomyces globisporus TaxID=1908 RepID=A0ABM9GXM4_STRGL|nr:hypothetical protein SGL43_03049 [Streptomyces globisporus]